MYFASYELDGGSYVVGVIRWQKAGPSLLPFGWSSTLLAARSTSFGIRLSVMPSGRTGTLVVGSLSNSTDGLQRLVSELERQFPGVTLPVSPEEHDLLALDFPGTAIWLSRRGFSERGRALVPDVRLFPVLQHIARAAGTQQAAWSYQVNLHPYVPNSDDVRQARKFVAALQIERSLPPPISELQSTIAQRLLQPAFLCDEFLGSESAATIEQFAGILDDHFTQVMGPYGFKGSPLETGDFREVASTVVPLESANSEEWLLRGASAIRSEDANSLLNVPLIGRENDGSGEGSGVHSGALVFISYASRDYLVASEVCRGLEENGIACWMAPRDIPPGEAFPSAIVRAIESCACMVVMLSSAANASLHVEREVEGALHRKTVLIPLRVEEVVPTGSLEYLLGAIQWIDGFGGQLPQAVAKLSVRLGHISAG